MIRFLVFCLFLAPSLSWSAGWSSSGSNNWRVGPLMRTEKGMQITPPPPGALGGGQGGSVAVYKAAPLTIVGEAVEIVGQQRLTNAALAVGLVSVFAGPVGGPVLAVVSQVLNGLADKAQIVCPTGGSSCVYDEGAEPTPNYQEMTAYSCPISNTGQGVTKDVPVATAGACSRQWCLLQGNSSDQCPSTISRLGPNLYMINRNGEILVTHQVAVPTCPDRSHFIGDGSKCSGGAQSPVTSDQAKQAIQNALNAPDNAENGQPRWSPSEIAQKLVDQDIPLDLEQAPPDVSGPTTITGKPKETTTQNPDGTVSKTVSNDVATCTYSGNNVNCSVNTSITNQTITNNNGTATTTTTSTTTKPADTPQDPCTNNASRVGCMDTGDIPGDKPAWRTADVVYSPDALGLPAFCPADQTWVLPHVPRPLVWSYQPACAVAPVVRAGLLALTAVGCVLLIVRTVRT